MLVMQMMRLLVSPMLNFLIEKQIKNKNNQIKQTDTHTDRTPDRQVTQTDRTPRETDLLCNIQLKR